MHPSCAERRCSLSSSVAVKSFPDFAREAEQAAAPVKVRVANWMTSRMEAEVSSAVATTDAKEAFKSLAAWKPRSRRQLTRKSGCRRVPGALARRRLRPRASLVAI